MTSTFRIIAAIALGALLLARAGSAEEPAAGRSEGVLVLRNGEVLQGDLRREGDRYNVIMHETEISVRAAEVEFVCRNLDEGYEHKRLAIWSGKTEDHLDLAEWCLRQQLTGYAARELADAIALDPHHPRLALVERRLAQANLPPKPPEAAAAPVDKPENINDELERLVRGMPHGAVETFTSTIQPLLLNHCSTAGCHGPTAQHKMSLLRMPPAKTANRRTTLRNLHNVLQVVDRKNPAESLLLTAALRPHGTMKAAVFPDKQAMQFRQLAEWVLTVTADTATPIEPATALPHKDAAKTDAVQAHHQELLPPPRKKPSDSSNSRPQTSPASRPPGILPPQPTAIPIKQEPPKHDDPPPAAADPFDPEIFNRQKDGKE